MRPVQGPQCMCIAGACPRHLPARGDVKTPPSLPFPSLLRDPLPQNGIAFTHDTAPLAKMVPLTSRMCDFRGLLFLVLCTVPGP